MTPVQCCMARAGLRWSTSRLAEEAGVTTRTVSRFESGRDPYQSIANKLENAFLLSGRVRFEGEGCVCVTDRRQQAERPFLINDGPLQSIQVLDKGS